MAAGGGRGPAGKQTGRRALIPNATFAIGHKHTDADETKATVKAVQHLLLATPLSAHTLGPPTCIGWLLLRFWQLSVPPTGPHPQVIHQDCSPLQLEPKLTLQHRDNTTISHQPNNQT